MTTWIRSRGTPRCWPARSRSTTARHENRPRRNSTAGASSSRATASSSGQERARPPKPDSSPSGGERRRAEGGSGNESTEIEGGECPPVRADWFLQLEELLEQRGGQVSKPVPVNVPGAKPEVYTGHPPGMARERRTRRSAP